MDDGKIVLTQEQLKERMLPYVKVAWKEAQDFLAGKKKELGKMYNHRNNYEMVKERFGDAENMPEKYVNEYILIQNKASRLPASVRKPIQQIGARAVNLMLMDMKKSLSPNPSPVGEGNSKPDWANGVVAPAESGCEMSSAEAAGSSAGVAAVRQAVRSESQEGTNKRKRNRKKDEQGE